MAKTSFHAALFAPKFSSNHLSETESGSPIMVTFPATQSDVQRNPKLAIAPPVIHLNLRYLVSEGSKKQHRLETWKTKKQLGREVTLHLNLTLPTQNSPKFGGGSRPYQHLFRPPRPCVLTDAQPGANDDATPIHLPTFMMYAAVCHEAKPQLTNRPGSHWPKLA